MPFQNCEVGSSTSRTQKKPERAIETLRRSSSLLRLCPPAKKKKRIRKERSRPKRETGGAVPRGDAALAEEAEALLAALAPEEALGGAPSATASPLSGRFKSWDRIFRNTLVVSKNY